MYTLTQTSTDRTGRYVSTFAFENHADAYKKAAEIIRELLQDVMKRCEEYEDFEDMEAYQEAKEMLEDYSGDALQDHAALVDAWHANSTSFEELMDEEYTIDVTPTTLVSP